MKGIFGKSSRNPAEVVRNMREDLVVLEKGADGKKQERVRIRQHTCRRPRSHVSAFPF